MAELMDDRPPADELDAARGAMWDMITGYRNSQLARVAAALSLAEHCACGPVTAAGRRGLSPLFWTHVNPYGHIRVHRADPTSVRPASQAVDQAVQRHLPSPREQEDREYRPLLR